MRLFRGRRGACNFFQPNERAVQLLLFLEQQCALGVEIAGSRAFSLCQVEKVFQNVCFRPPQTLGDATEIERIATLFENSAYRMKTVFAEVAAHCRGN